jgi:CRISPR-associated protein Csx10
MSPARLQLRIDMESDWQIGTGTRVPGGADDLVARDRDGLPWVPSKTLAGIWRDACETIARGLDTGQPGDGGWVAWAGYVFGDQPAIEAPRDGLAPSPGRLMPGPATFPTELRDLVTGDAPGRALLRESFTFFKPGVEIDPASGRAREDHYRLEEVCRAGAALQAECELDVPDDAMPTALTLLAAGALLVERLGGKRRRGSGRCRWRLAAGDVDLDAVALLESAATPGPPPEQERRPIGGDRLPQAKPGWWRLPLRIAPEQPIVVAERVVGNVVETTDHVPGAMLLPWITSTLNALDIDAATLVRQDRLRVLPAYPEVCGGSDGEVAKRAIPAPLAFALPKRGGDLAVPGRAVNRMRERVEAGAQARDVPAGTYVAGDRDEPGLCVTQVRPSLSTHNTIEDARQRPTTEVGGVYSYQAIPAGTALRAELLLDAGVVADLDGRQPGWWRRFAGLQRLGRARKDAYGGVTVSAEPPVELPATWEQPVGDTFTVLLESDLLLRSPAGRPATDLDSLVEALAAEVRVPGLEVVRLPEAEGGERLAFVATRRQDGWQTAWHLPRPSLMAIAAGTCLQLRTPPGLTGAALARLERDGLGLRRAEGFGRLRVNDPLLDRRLNTAAPTEAMVAATDPPDADAARTPPAPRALPADDPNARFARAVERAAWRASIIRASAHMAASPTARARIGLARDVAGLTRSQVGGLRGALRRLDRIDGPGAKAASRWLEQKARGRAIFRRIEELLEHESAVWTLMDELNASATLGLAWPALVSHANELRAALWAEAVRAVVSHAAAGFARDHRQREAVRG